MGTSVSDRTDTFASGLHVIDIGTGGADFSLTNGTWSLTGESDTSIIFRVSKEGTFYMSEARLGVFGDLGLKNVLFLVDADKGDQSFNLSNAYFNGIAFWDFGRQGSNNYTTLSQVKGCGQLVNDRVDLQNVSMSHCAYNPTTTTSNTPPPAPVPVPASLPFLLTGLSFMAFMARRRRNAAEPSK